jgi:hypothetical protein
MGEFMRHVIFAIIVLGSFIDSSIGQAAPGTPLPGDRHQPAVFLDVPALWVHVVSRGDEGYEGRAFLRIGGATSKGDRMRIEWRSAGKVLAVGPCNTSWERDEQTLAGACALDKNVRATGPIEVAVVYTDDQQDQDYLVATLKTEVRAWKGIGKTQSWGIVPDDLLAVAFVRHWDGASATRAPLIQFWSTSSSLHGKAALRCSVGGKKLPDLEAHLDTANHGTDQATIESSFTTATMSRTYTFQHYELDPGFRYGPKTKKDEALSPDRARFAVDTPGAWECVLRKDGKQVRQFLFTVDDKGMIQDSEMQRGGRALKTLPGVALIDMKIPADNGVEQRIRPEALRRSIGFGLPWPDHPRAREIQATFPPASGLPD